MSNDDTELELLYQENERLRDLLGEALVRENNLIAEKEALGKAYDVFRFSVTGVTT